MRVNHSLGLSMVAINLSTFRFPRAIILGQGIERNARFKTYCICDKIQYFSVMGHLECALRLKTEEAIWRVLLLNFRLALLWLQTNHILLKRCGESRLSSQGPLFHQAVRLYSGEPQGGTVDISCIRACFWDGVRRGHWAASRTFALYSILTFTLSECAATA